MTVTKVGVLPAAGMAPVEEDVRSLPEVRQAQVLALMDQLDEEAIIAEIHGAAPDKFAYRIELDTQEGKREVVGLGKVGVDLIVRKLADKGIVLREVESRWEDHGDYATFEITVQRVRVGKPAILEDGRMVQPEVLLETHKGFKRQEKKTKKRDGRMIENRFWFEVGYAKAVRNAQRRFLPEEQVARMIRGAIASGKLGVFDEKGEAKAPPPTPPPDPRSLSALLVDLNKAYGKGIADADLDATLQKVTKGKLGWPIPDKIEEKYAEKVKGALRRALVKAPPIAATSEPVPEAEVEDTPF